MKNGKSPGCEKKAGKQKRFGKLPVLLLLSAAIWNCMESGPGGRSVWPVCAADKAAHVTALEAAEKAGSRITVKKYGEEESSGYSFRLKRTENTTCTWNDASGISGKKPYHQNGTEGMERWGQIITSDKQKGKISCYLSNTGSYKGKNTNLRITFTDWPDYRTESGEKYYPVVGVALNEDFYGLTFSDIWYEAKLEILDDRGNPLKVDTTYRAEDLDYGQILGIKKSDGIDAVNIPEDSRVYYMDRDGFYYFYAKPEIESEEYDKDSVQIQYGEISSFSLRVGGGQALPGSWLYEKYVPVSVQKAYEKLNHYMVGEGTTDAATEGGAVLGWIAGSAKGYGPFTPPKPVKTVSRTEVHGEEPFTYRIEWRVPECQPADYYTYMRLTDILPEAVACDSVAVYDADNKKDVSGSFSVRTEKGKRDTVTVSAKDTRSAWIYGKSFEVRIQVHKRPEYVFENGNVISNQAELAVEDGKKPEKTKQVRTSFYYEITTEAVNGSITPSDYKVPAGSKKEIVYSPGQGCYLKSVHVDDQAADGKEYRSGCSFAKVNADHHIKVVYAKKPVITVTKEVTGRWEPFGTPIFLFEISGTDYEGQKRSYHEAVSIPEQFEENGIYKKSFRLEIPAGRWTVSEIPVSRYKFTAIRDVLNGTVSGKTVVLDTLSHDAAQATFCNELKNYGNFSHNDIKINEFGR